MKQALRKQAEVLAAHPYTVEVTRDETTDGQRIYLLSHPELPGCMGQGATIEEAEINLQDARIEYILSLLEDGLSVPEPESTATKTGSVEGGAQTIIAKWEPADRPDILRDLAGVNQSQEQRHSYLVSVKT